MFFYPHKKYLPTAVIVLLLTVFAQAAQAARQSPVWLDRISIIVNNEIITQSDLEARMRTARNNLRQRKIKLPSRAILKRQVTDVLIQEQLQLQYAKKLGIEVTGTQVDAAINDMARQNNLSRFQFLARAKRDKVDIAALKRDLRRQLIVRELVNRVVNRQIQVSEHEVDSFLADRTRQGVRQEFNLSHILISVAPGAPASARRTAAKKAKNIRKKIIAGAAFESLAIAHSKGPNALKGGALGWRKAGQLPDLFIAALKNKTRGAITAVLESPNGFHILRVNNSRGGLTMALVKQIRARHILLKPSAIQSIGQARATAKKLRKRIIAGEDFASLAKKYSNDAGSASQGGDLGWTSSGQLVGEIEKAMNKLKPGETSQPIQSRFGIHLLQVIEKRQKDMGKQRRRMGVRQQIHARKSEEKLQQWLLELRSQAYIEVVAN